MEDVISEEIITVTNGLGEIQRKRIFVKKLFKSLLNELLFTRCLHKCTLRVNECRCWIG